MTRRANTLLDAVTTLLWRARLVVIVALSFLVTSALESQVQPRDPGRAISRPNPGDTTRRAPGDTARATRQRPGQQVGRGADTTTRELVKWAEEDSVMKALLSRRGFVATRYQGDTVYFDSQSRTLVLTGNPAAVERDRTVLVGDTVLYNDSTEIVEARGDSVILRDPARNDSDLIASGRIKYSIPEQRGVISNLSTTVENSGQRWIVFGEQAAVVSGRDTVPQVVVEGDSTFASGRHTAFYAKDGAITSCEESSPHYHFQSKEIKVVTNGILVARPAVLYIADVPVMWLPFIFQDLRRGRRSGILTPRFGVSELLRNSPSYRRTVENLGYYFALSDFMDAAVSIDWRSGAAGAADPGWTRFNGILQYKWLDRFIDGRFGISGQRMSDGSSMQQYSLAHRQDFSQRSHLNANLNYSTNTSIQRRSTLDPRAVVATIYSQANYQQTLGKVNFSIGGTQKQYPGRTEINRDFPSLNIAAQPIEVAEWLTWTPTFRFAQRERLKIDLPGEFATVYRLVDVAGGGVRLDSITRLRDERATEAALETPLKLFGVTFTGGIRFSETLQDYPASFVIPDTTPAGTGDTTRRVFSKNFLSRMDWDVGFSLPPVLQGTWNIVPSVSLVNVDGGPFLVRSHFSGGDWVSQRKRLVYGVGASPTFYGLFPGFGPVRRFRHSISPSLSYAYAPAADVSNEYLYATGQRRANYLGSLAQNRLSLSLATNVEAKVGEAADTLPESGRKVRVVSVSFTSLSYDFERLGEIRRRRGSAEWFQGLTTDRFGYTLKSDLLPGIDIGVGYSLFQGSITSDTAEFSPYREDIRASFSLNRNSALFATLYRLLGGRGRETDAGATSPPNAPQPNQATQYKGPSDAPGDYQNIAGVSSGAGVDRIRNQQLPSGRGWQATFSVSSSRPRPPRGGVQVSTESTAHCELLRPYPVEYQQCIANPSGAGVSLPYSTTPGGAVYTPPPVTNLSSQLGFNLTPKWAAQWQTSYDFERREFASHIVSLQRELHDWRATFAFTQAPNGAFSFSFFIALKAEPDIKFDYRKNTYSGR
jgi:lipopolysaccharide assembly outer membrane protein LptD (OstA)